MSEHIEAKPTLHSPHTEVKRQKRDKAYYAKNRDAILREKGRYYAKNKADILRKQRERIAKNPQKHREYCKKQSREKRRKKPESTRKYEREYARKWRSANPEKSREKSKKSVAKFRKNNPDYFRVLKRNSDHKRRAKKKSNSSVTVTGKQLMELKERQRECHYCKTKKGRLTYDHVVPISKGGAHSIENIVMACSGCNFTKHTKLIHEFAKERGVLFF